MKTFLLCGALAALLLPAAAQARPANDDLPQVVVHYADLDLDRPAGADVMIARVRRAARSVCQDQMFAPRTQVRRTNACVRTAMTDAFAQLDAPLVTARYLKTVPTAEFAAQ
jgi:UrcA family protein